MLIKLYRNLSAPPFSRPVIICTTLGVFLLDVNIVLNFVEDTFLFLRTLFLIYDKKNLEIRLREKLNTLFLLGLYFLNIPSP